jgi:hypothetical protein
MVKARRLSQQSQVPHIPSEKYVLEDEAGALERSLASAHQHPSHQPHGIGRGYIVQGPLVISDSDSRGTRDERAPLRLLQCRTQ